MTSLQDRIAQFRKMALDDPENELGHFRLGQLLMEDQQLEEAARSFRRTIELSPQFSKAIQLLGACLIKLDQRQQAIDVLKNGFVIAHERGDNIPRDEMGKLLAQLGESAPVVKEAGPQDTLGGPGFKCKRPGCLAGARARQLAKPPMNDANGVQVYETVCADCWDYWLRNLSIKVINEMRLDLSDEKHVDMYDQVMRETLGLS